MKSTQAAAAGKIRKELKALFPKTPFSITSHCFSMGDDVKIKWIDGPTYTQINEIVTKYEHGSYNCMDDLYEYNNVRDDVPQVKYVIPNRGFSEKTKENTRQEIMKRYDLNDFSDKTIMKKFDCWPDQLVYRFLQDKEL